MDMTCKYSINFVLHKRLLMYHSHGFSFHIMNIVAIAPWGMHYNQKKNPWSLNSVNFWFLFCTTNCTEEWSKLNALERKQKIT